MRNWTALDVIPGTDLCRTGDDRTCVYIRGTESGGPCSRNSSRSCSGGWRGRKPGPPLPPHSLPSPPPPGSSSSLPASPWATNLTVTRYTVIIISKQLPVMSASSFYKAKG